MARVSEPELTHRYPKTMCWHCDRAMDAITSVGDQVTADEAVGGVALCLYCGAVGFIGPDLAPRRPFPHELDELREDGEFMQMFCRFQWARQRVILTSKLMGYEAERDGGDR